MDELLVLGCEVFEALAKHLEGARRETGERCDTPARVH